MGVGDHYPAVLLHRVEGVAHDHRVGVCGSCRVESVNAVGDEVLIGFKMKVSVLPRQRFSQRAFSAAG